MGSELAGRLDHADRGACGQAVLEQVGTVPLRGDRVGHHVNHISVATPEHAVGPLRAGQGVGVPQYLHKAGPLVGGAYHRAHPAVSGREDPVVPVGVSATLIRQLGKCTT